MKTNREHFSWSQYDLWHRSKREYWKRYSLGAEQKSNRFFDKGKELATFIETGEVISSGNDGFLKLVAEQVPKLDIPEQELRFSVVLNTGEDKEILCFVDSGAEDGTEFLEYKTGKIPWTQERVDKHDQMLFYALGYFLNGCRAVPKAKLVWVETMDTKEDGLLYTGKVECFERKITTDDLADFHKRVVDTIEEIELYDYQELEVDNNDVDRYVYLLQVIEEAQLELSGIKMKVEGEMVEADVTFGKGAQGNFIIQNRKTWQYSEVVDELKKDIKRQQVAEQKDNTATFTVGQSIMFKLNK